MAPAQLSGSSMLPSVLRTERELKLLIRFNATTQKNKEQEPNSNPSMPQQINGSDITNEVGWKKQSKNLTSKINGSDFTFKGPLFSWPPESELKSLRLKAIAAAARTDKNIIKEKNFFSISLSKDEIEEDFLKMTRSKRKPPRKLKKRAKKKEINVLFPGLGLSNITPESYRVDDFSKSRKRKLQR